MIFNQMVKKLKRESGYTLTELLLTILIVGIILTAVSVILIDLIRISRVVDAQRIMRQDSEYSIEILSRDIRNATPGGILPNCDSSGTDFVMDAEEDETQLNIELVSGETVTYGLNNVRYENRTVKSLVRTFQGSVNTETVLTTQVVDAKRLELDCKTLAKGNKFVELSFLSDSSASEGGEPIVTDFLQESAVTVRNTE